MKKLVYEFMSADGGLQSQQVLYVIIILSHTKNLLQATGADPGGARGASAPPFKIFCISYFYLIQHENIIQGCLISFIIIQVYTYA